MERGDLGFLFGAAGLLLGGVAVFMSVSAQSRVESIDASVRNVMAQDNESLGALGDELSSVKEAVASGNRRMSGIQEEAAEVREAVMNHGGRIAALEAGGVARNGDGGGGAKEPKEPALPAAGDTEEFERLRELVFAETASAEEEARFWKLTRERPELLAGVLTGLESAVKDRPRDIDARMNLAQAYLTKLFSSPPGPEMGLWANKAMGQWKTVLEQEPNHWEARFSMGISYGEYPEFMNKTPDAIREFETLRGIQEAGTSESKHAATYAHLARLYGKQGNAEKARASIEEGLRRFPEDADLKKAQEAMQK